MNTCPHGKLIDAECGTCKGEAVRAAMLKTREGRMMLGVLPEPLTPEQARDLDIYHAYVGRMRT